MAEENRMSIYRACRSIKRKDNSLYNALRSIYDDSVFVGEISQIWPELPLLANLRCGLWYSPKFEGTCYFKSTDGHQNNWSFITSRLNLHVAQLAGQRGGCMIIDSTRKGKRFPDSMSKTIPIWTCVLNRAIQNYRNQMSISASLDNNVPNPDWDCSLHLPLWVPETEKAAIEDRLEDWTKKLEDSGAHIGSLALSLKKPLRPLWVSPKTVIWLNEVPEYDSWDFTPVMLVSASSPDARFQQRTTSEFSWNYIPGAGDDEESWARGLTPNLFWNHVYDIINLGPDMCNQKVADIVEKDRVRRAQRGQYAPQTSLKVPKVPVDNSHISTSGQLEVDLGDKRGIFWLGPTNLAVGPTNLAADASDMDCVLNCDKESVSSGITDPESYLHLRIVNSKMDRFSLLRSLHSAVNFAKVNLQQGRKILVCCRDGEDISVCVSLAIMTSLFTDEGMFDEGISFRQSTITKLEMRRRKQYHSVPTETQHGVWARQLRKGCFCLKRLQKIMKIIHKYVRRSEEYCV